MLTVLPLTGALAQMLVTSLLVFKLLMVSAKAAVDYGEMPSPHEDVQLASTGGGSDVSPGSVRRRLAIGAFAPGELIAYDINGNA